MAEVISQVCYYLLVTKNAGKLSEMEIWLMVYLCDLELVEHILQDLVVLNHIVFVLGIKINLAERESKFEIYYIWSCQEEN